MNKLPIILFVLLLPYYSCYSQEDFDPGKPTNSSFEIGGDIQGTIQNSVNEVTGKVTLSAPLASIASASVSYGINLTYNGQSSFKSGQQTNKYNPTSTVGVGWSMGVPKIVVDNKSTGTRDDDVFYLLDGATNAKLICVDKGTTSNGSVWQYQMEKYAPWKIEFYYHNSWSDYWKITDDKGLVYYYGNPGANTARDHVVCYGNWIGSSVQSGASGQQTIQWSLYKIEDQWGHNLIFEYDYVTQTISGFAQTEASYLKKVTSSNGANIQLVYGDKTADEFYEPHQEMNEPDAYQERYEKKYLQSVSSYNNDNQLVSTFNLGYTLNGTSLNKKRYLTSLIQTAYNNGQNETLPAQTFDYHYTGTFKGGIKTITYPTGGSVTYNYNNKFLFNNSGNKYESTITWPSGYGVHSRVVKDNYTLYFLRSLSPFSGGKYRFKVFRLWWNGEAWEHNEFTFPHLIDDQLGNRLKDFYVVLENDFYGFSYDKGTSYADVYLFHLNKDGRSWHEYSSISKSIAGGGQPYFLSGNDFAALGAYHSGDLYTYVWNGSYWNYEHIDQGDGEYFMAATNNYIISLDENGGYDMNTTNNYNDNYYIHYLDAEKNWQSKSWSAKAAMHINSIEATSYFYPDNSIIGFVAEDNPEFFLRWDTDYNLTNVDNVLGTHNDSSPIQCVANSLFTIYDSVDKTPYKSARFNGINWKVETPTAPAYGNAYLQFGLDLFSCANTLRSPNNYSTYDCKYYNYDPNTNSWSNDVLYGPNDYYDNPYNPINLDFMVVGKKFFNKSIDGTSPLFSEIGSLDYDSRFAYSNGQGLTIIEQLNYVKLYYIDKSDGLLEYSELNQKKYKDYYNLSTIFGGYRPFISSRAICFINSGSTPNNYLYDIQDVDFYRVIDDKVNNAVYDIVVNHLDINDDNGSLRKVQYTYNNPKCAPDNSATFYGEVIIENKGTGIGNIGKVVKVFNDGSEDLAMVGLPMETITIDANNAMVKKNTMTWQKFTKSSYNGTKTIDKSYYIRATKEKEELFFEDSPKVDSETTYAYNSLGLKTSATTSNSTGISEKQEITYAYQQYSFVNDKNMLAFPYQTTSKISNTVVNVEQAKWINDNGKAYINENWSGPTTSNLRLNSKISKVETTGNVLENNNGKGLYNSVLFGYENLYEVATIQNAEYQDVIDELDVTYLQLQSLTTANLKVELLKLYDRLPNASIELKFYDNNGRVISKVDSRREEVFIEYDPAGRLDYITDAQGKILEKKEYHFAN